ncbi:histidine phosphatase family protein [Paraliomyxa miuraensis]|uniref:histidine phosphatase family protein n=1 Tax=Paraliomyxa miuraensis TaxID=376150 RepID=UPI002258B5A9|nr:histidine phosphatase family protein [Paraliomyxa miuraensis]MCX4242761.1 histidine phosphatase family protein [Paraliomyxa miuraensis]
MPTWTFIRHGQSVANVEGWLAGHLDTPLTTLGAEQAVAARRELVEPLPTRAVCSDLRRAHHTARLLLAEHSIPLIVSPRLRERDCGAWQRRSTASIVADPERRRCLASWIERPPRGESLLDVALRAVGWLSTIADAQRDTLVVAHGALIRAVLAAIDHLPRDRVDQWHPGNCEATRRDVSGETWHVLLDDLRREASLTSRVPSR